MSRSTALTGYNLKRFALLGEPVGHSLSPLLHKAIYRQLEIDDASYRTVELPEERLKSFFTGFRVGGFDGVNVTIPHKSRVIQLLDEVDSKAKLIDAVNCVNRVGNKLTGYNTDLLGFAYSLRQNNVHIDGNVFAILGAGGSAQAVGAVLAEGAAKQVYIVNRTPERAERLKEIILAVNDAISVTVCSEQELAERSAELDCVINTTSLGMAPNTKMSPISESIFSENCLAFDLVYSPMKTKFLSDAESQGAAIVNGLQMLVAQAVYSVEIWMGGNIVAHVDMNALVRDLEKAIK
ncbi:shikimate dehydrogenase [Arenicella xantha]|uniref:Shikimate dehydrogenase (NADP(+)) n=1 Tax=Arenicella xantha TaxID=644221 RepID=A0A395JJ36_9GAMM|nr:shikimate dehydrogenase [Arenicella xantha]